MSDQTIRRRLTRGVLGAFVTTLTITGVGGFWIVQSALQEQFDAALSAQADAVGSVMTWDQGRLQIVSTDRFIHEFDAVGRNEEISGGDRAPSLPVEAHVYEVWRADTSSTLARSPSLGHNDLRLPEMPTRARPIFWNMRLPSGTSARAVAARILPRLAREGIDPPIDVVLMVAADRRGLDRTLQTVRSALYGSGLVLLLVTIVVIPRVLKRELTPLDRLADQTAHIDAQTLTTRLPTDGLPAELRPIAERLNDLLQRLEHAFARERQFSANVAHELRTPLAELRTATELALKWPDARASTHDRDTLLIAEHMEAIVTRLLALLRSERHDLPIHPEPVNVSDLLTETWTPLAARAEANALTVTWRVPADIVIHTDRALLRSILTNLLENAAEYTPANGAIDIACHRTDADCRLRVINTAPTLQPTDLPNLFTPFWRHDTARTDTTHTGLGLSLAHTFAESLHGTLTATLDERGQLVMVLSLAC